MFFYSGFGFTSPGWAIWAGRCVAWQHKGDVGEGHSKPFNYWCTAADARGAVGGVRPAGVSALRRAADAPAAARLGAALLVLCLGVAVYELSPPGWFPDVRIAVDGAEDKLFRHVRRFTGGWGF